MTKKIRVTLTMEFEPKPQYYPGCTTIEEMMAMEESGADIDLWVESLAEKGTLKFEVVDEGP